MNILIDAQTLHTPEINRGIGTYFKEMLESMLKSDFINTFYITAQDTHHLNPLSDFAKSKLKLLTHHHFNPNNLLSQTPQKATITYSNLINEVCQENNIDIYFNPNPQMSNIVLPRKMKHTKYVATIHDLIPLVMKDTYLSLWSKTLQQDYSDKLDILKEYDHLFPISKSTKQDISSLISIPDEKQTITFEGVSNDFDIHPFPNISADEDYILYIGGFDPRKNMLRAIEAFAFFMQNYNTNSKDYKLYLVCSLNKEEKSELLAYAKKHNIQDSILLTGFVKHHKLLNIYKNARCFFFPSLYEGFGLPILEALASGLPVVCSNNSSLPEVAGKDSYYFDPYNIKDMAQSLQKVLNQDMTLPYRKKRHDYASQFTWQKPATIMLNKMQNLLDTKTTPIKKLAWVSPFPPQRSGIANYSEVLLLAMKDDADISIYYDNVLPSTELQTMFKTKPLDQLPKDFDTYDEVIYHIGNNTEFHTNIYNYAWNYPSTVVIHDSNIHPFLKEAFLNSKDKTHYDTALKIHTDESSNNDIDVFKYPMSDAIAQRSKRVIVHHRWVKEQLLNNSNVEVIPHFAYIQPEYQQPILPNDEFTITTFGDINTNKLPDIQIQAAKILLDDGYPIRWIFAGKTQPETKILFTNLKNTPYEDNIISTGYLTNQEYFQHIYSCDLSVNLRNPSMGEASGTLTQALFASKPLIIGDLQQYQEFPDDILAGKIKYNGDEVSQLVNIIKTTLKDKQKRELIQTNAKNYANTLLSLKNITKLYLKG